MDVYRLLKTIEIEKQEEESNGQHSLRGRIDEK